jgi:DNA (cytosine-5)-methyltransferase 1
VSDLGAISLFSGAGGLNLGVERAGYGVLTALEYDADTAATLRANFPKTQVLERDIRSVETRELLEAAELQAGEAELLVGGPSGLANTATSTCSITTFESLAMRRPRAFLLENVFGLACRNHNVFWSQAAALSLPRTRVSSRSSGTPSSGLRRAAAPPATIHLG